MAIEQIDWERSFLEPYRDAELEAQLRKSNGGALPPGTRFVSHCPWLARSNAYFNFFNERLVFIDFDLAQRLSLVISQDNSCRYCFAAHRILMRFAGVSEERIRRLEQDLLTLELPDTERAAIAFARRLSRASPRLTDSDLEPLRAAGWQHDAIREIALVCGGMLALNRYSTFLALDPEPLEAFPDRWHIRLLAPLFGRVLRTRSRRGRMSPFSETERHGPFATVTNAFDGLPLGRSLRTVIDEAWASTALAHGTKALIAAVVARGIGDDLVLGEARTLALESGVDEQVFDEVLAHLDAPTLTETDRIAVAFARESIWYQPIPLQRRTVELSTILDVPQLLDLVGFASFANVIARLGVFADT